MRLWINAFILVFLLDGILGLADALPAEAFSTIEASQAALLAKLCAWGLGMGTLVLLAISPRPSKTVLLPLILFLPLEIIYQPSVRLLLDARETALVFSALQIGIAAVALGMLRYRTNGASWLFTRSCFSGPVFRVGNTLGFLALGAVVLAPALLLNLYLSVNLALHQLTAGFVHLGPAGIWTEEREYVHGDRTIYLIGMIHIGDDDFYQGLMSALPKQNTVVLEEGISDHQRRLQGSPSYVKLASRLGKRSQSEAVDYDGYVVRSADIDTSQFSATTVELLNLIIKALDAETKEQAVPALQRFSAEVVANENYRTLVYDLIERRNSHLLREIDRALEHHDQVIVPWGAAHMPGILTGILRDGFQLKVKQERLAIAF